jgi:organic hydroperoxide reductase OsmC/OhrA
MADFPHVYTTNAQGSNDAILQLTSDKLPALQVSPPKEFGGPDSFWNPEALFSASISTCFILTYKAIARAKKLIWDGINVDADSYLDKNGHQLSFTRVDIFVTLTIPLSEAGKEDFYLSALEKAEETCLVTNSITATIKLYPKIILKE